MKVKVFLLNTHKKKVLRKTRCFKGAPSHGFTCKATQQPLGNREHPRNIWFSSEAFQHILFPNNPDRLQYIGCLSDTHFIWCANRWIFFNVTSKLLTLKHCCGVVLNNHFMTTLMYSLLKISAKMSVHPKNISF